MRRKLQKNKANTLFSIIPSEIVEDMGLKAGDKLDFRIEDEKIIAVPVRHKGVSEGDGIE